MTHMCIFLLLAYMPRQVTEHSNMHGLDRALCPGYVTPRTYVLNQYKGSVSSCSPPLQILTNSSFSLAIEDKHR